MSCRRFHMIGVPAASPPVTVLASRSAWLRLPPGISPNDLKPLDACGPAFRGSAIPHALLIAAVQPDVGDVVPRGLGVALPLAGLAAAALVVTFVRRKSARSKLHNPAKISQPLEIEDVQEIETPSSVPAVAPTAPFSETEPMPNVPIVKIDVVEDFVLRLENGALKLPPVEVVPTDPRNLPLAPSVAFQVTGTVGTESLARAIQKAYTDEAEQFRPASLKKPHRFEPAGFKSNEVLPRTGQLQLQIRVNVQVAGPNGAMSDAPPVQAVCRLTPGDDISVWREIVIEPQVMVLSQGTHEESSVKIKVRSFGGPSGRAGASGSGAQLAKPGLRISRESMEAIRELPELLAQLKRASEAIRYLLPAAGPESADGVHEYLLTARLDLPEHERKVLADITRDRSLILALTVHATGALPAALTVEVESVAGQFPGQFAVDFGTSSSTITIYEPRAITPRPLPIDQLEELRGQFARWLARPSDKALDDDWRSQKDLRGVRGVPWRGTLTPIKTSRHSIPCGKRFRPESSEKAVEAMHEAIRQIELNTSQQEPNLRRALRVKLHDIYSKAFRAFPFRQYNLTTLSLEGDALDMTSELEITATRPKLVVKMGADVREAREAFEISAPAQNGAAAASAPATSTATASTAGAGKPASTPIPPEVSDDPIVEGRFHRVPKRYLSLLNRERRISARIVRKSGVTERLDYAQLVGAAWDHLRGRFDVVRARVPDVYSRGRVRRAVVTYPTVLGPRARNEVVKLFHDMGVPTVRMIYDEAVAAAIFHLEKFFGGSYEVGPEAFKTRCRRQSEVWVQNMLVLDIGGGTTDLALIRLEMKQEPFKGADQGAGGRYYTIVPTLLGSSGNEFLGGELITLRTFRLLKLALADYVLRYDSAMIYPKQLSKARDLALARLGGKSAYQPGYLLQLIAAPNDDPNFKAALDAAEELLPTRFKTRPESRRAFQALWREAEKIKLALGRRREARPGAPDLPLQYTLDPAAVALLISDAWPGAEGQVKPTDKAQSLTLTSEAFERVAGPVVEQALRIAKGLSESAIRKYEADHLPASSRNEKLDRIVLSGKSCNLHIVHALLPQVMRECTYYGEDVTEVLFEDKLAKQATSVGACRAEEMWASLRPPDGWEATSGTGVSSVAFDIRNLFFFLPCSFWLKNQNEQPTVMIFSVNERFRMLDGSSMGKIRSHTPRDWMPPQPITRVYRIDYDGDGGINWGNYYLDSLERALGRDTKDLADELKVRFEIDHETLIKILICQQGRPKYSFNGRSKLVGEADVRPKLVEALKAGNKAAVGDPLAGHELRFDIAVDPVDNNPTVVCKAGTPFEHEAREPLPSLEGSPGTAPVAAAKPSAAPGSKGVMFALSGPLPKPRANRKYDFYARAAPTTDPKWVLLGSVQLPRASVGFEENWHATVAQDGYIRVMQGLPDYWRARRPQDLYDFPGTVLYQDLEAEDRDAEPDINPDSGIH